MYAISVLLANYKAAHLFLRREKLVLQQADIFLRICKLFEKEFEEL